MTDKLREAAREHVAGYVDGGTYHQQDLQELFEAGASYQKPITRQETIAEILARLRNHAQMADGDIDVPLAMAADWLQTKLRGAMEEKEK